MKWRAKALVVLLVACLSATSGCKAGEENDVVQQEADVVESPVNEFTLVEKLEPVDYLAELAKQYPVLEHLRLVNEAEWEAIKLTDGVHEVSLDPSVFENLLHLFLLRENDMDFPNGIHGEIDPFTVELKNADATIRIDVQSRNYGMLPDISPDIYRLDGDLANLGSAFLPRPDYLPKESLESRLMDSGAMLQQSDGYSFYTLSEFRIRGAAISFLAGEKKAVEEPEDIPSEWMMQNVFFLHGETIVMRIYNNHILLIDGDDRRYWYEVDPELAVQIQSTLSAG